MVVPIICDPAEFQLQASARPPAGGGETIVYAGSLTEQKDGFFTLIRAFATLAGQRPRARLIALGVPDLASDGVRARQLVRELGLEERVEFRGFVPRQEYVRLLSSAGLLVLAKPGNVQNDYNMPTKVADYLLSGRPTLVTKCGVIANELRDGENVFLAEPGDPEDFAKKMLWILNHTADANRVGLAGRAYALRHYDYRVHGSRIVAFLRQLRDLKARRSPLAWQSTDGS
jgi:glycosyltransferase involved in cell wall biosynthesis